MKAARREVPQRRQIFAVSHPEETIMLALGTVAAAASVHRIWKLESRTRELEQTLTSQREAAEARASRSEARERELRNANDAVRRMYDAIRDEKMRMEASIWDRGRAGEKVLGDVLDGCRAQGIVKDFRLQHEIAPGEIPDAVVEVVDEVFVVVDSKAPTPPYDIDDQLRKEYVDKLKGHIRQLCNKRYGSFLNNTRCPTVTVMMLPGEGYLHAAYEEGRDVFELSTYARERNVMVVGPNGLRTSLEVWKMWFEEQASKDRLNDERVRENIATTLQPLWVERLLPLVKSTGNLLEKVVASWNSRVDDIVAFDRALRCKDILDLAEAKKTKLPKKITIPKSIDDLV